MTNEETIAKIEKQISYIQPQSVAYRNGHITALRMAIKALEKQMQYEFLISRACAELNYYQAKLYEAEKVLYKEGHIEYAIPYSIQARTPDEWREYLEEQQ